MQLSSGSYFLFPQLFVFLLQIKAFFWTLSHPPCSLCPVIWSLYYILCAVWFLFNVKCGGQDHVADNYIWVLKMAGT